MQSNIPRAAIHVGKDKKSFSAQVGNEAERRGWDENVYRLKNADKEKNNHYNFSRKNLNFEIVRWKDCPSWFQSHSTPRAHSDAS